jgi:hypothetical protein
MSSSPLKPQELNDLLHKLITESTKVEAIFSCPPSGLSGSVSGFLRVDSNGGHSVSERDEPKNVFLLFDPSRAVDVRYGDRRAFKDSPAKLDFFTQNFASSLSLTFVDGTRLLLLEVAD